MLLPLLLACALDTKPPAGTDGDDTAPRCGAWWPDADGDGYGDGTAAATEACGPPEGYVSGDDDCDDTRADRAPGVAEACDGVDQDCDGLVDEGFDVHAWWPDADGDGFGDSAGTRVSACEAPAGHLRDATDCDDTDPTVSPAGVEVCDGRDQDCNGVVDEGALLDVYADLDGDGYGDAASRVRGCAGDGWTEDDADCDDALAEVHPGAVEECGNDRDDNCDGSGLGCGLSGVALARDGHALLLGDAPGDLAGFAVADAGDVDGDGYADLLVGAHGRDDFTGAAYVVRGPVSGSTYLEDAALVLRGEDAGDSAGVALAGVGDATGDGVPDVLVSAYADDSMGSYTGAVYLVDGASTGEVSLASGATATLLGEAAGDYAGRAVAGLGDIDGDGLADLLVGAPRMLTAPGAAYVVYGGVAGTVSLGESPTLVGVEGQTGIEVAGADMDGDGIGDAIVRAETRVYVVHMPVSVDFDLDDADAIVQGTDYLDAGAPIGDVDGDGLVDLALGEPQASGEVGEVILYLAPLAGTLGGGDASAIAYGAGPGDWFGATVADAGDLDGDGRAEVIVTATYGGFSDVGAAHVLYGAGLGLEASLELADIEYPGMSATGVGDTDGDGVDDVLLGSPGDGWSTPLAGAAYLFLGGEGW
ncbi:MAG: MopE-related protein [Pseudomonadota bacterium]|nr:MopE-related protein [Pseudomonadota bacterium]